MKLLLDAGTAAVHVVEVPVARGEAEPLRHLVVAEHVEAQPVAILPIAGRLADRDADLARGHVLLAAVDQLAGEHEAARGLPHGVEVDDPARAMAVRGLLGPPAGADAEVEEPISGDRREADASAVGVSAPKRSQEKAVGQPIVPMPRPIRWLCLSLWLSISTAAPAESQSANVFVTPRPNLSKRKFRLPGSDIACDPPANSGTI